MIKRIEVLPLATSHIAIAHLCNRFNHVFAQPIFMSRFKSFIFYKNKRKIKLFLQKNAKLWALGLRLHTPETAPIVNL